MSMNSLLLTSPTQEAKERSQQARETSGEEHPCSRRVPADTASIPLRFLLEDLAQLAMSMEDVLDDLDRGREALHGLECWGPEIGNTPDNQALLQRIAQAKQAIPRVSEAVRQEVCGPLRQDLLLLACHVGKPSWRLLETGQSQEREECWNASESKK